MAWGYNGYGQLGVGQLGLGHDNHMNTPQTVAMLSSMNTPQLVAALSGKKVVAIAAGSSHSLVLLASGKVMAWGYNGLGQLGLGHDNNMNTPQLVAMLSDKKVVAIAAGLHHSLVLLASGKQGQLGLEHKNHMNTPQLVTTLSGKKVVAIAAGEFHSLVLLASGEVMAWGYNEQGQLGLRHNNHINTPQLVAALSGKKVVAIAARCNQSFVLLASGEVMAWGYNEQGQLGLRHNNHINTPQLNTRTT
eukprot:TRINITY_DN898_c0_g1_i9.p1 TRINITY_DN898_c0_g1~~TRINITY_DN898_c0_g1_i9.p1  ORF type:complete len:247 (-),score=32.91 TRINITY_DN898_c0_g1_i9:450-1190(-)